MIQMLITSLSPENETINCISWISPQTHKMWARQDLVSCFIAILRNINGKYFKQHDCMTVSRFYVNIPI